MRLSSMAMRWLFSHPLLAGRNNFVMHIEIRHQAFNPWHELEAYTRSAGHRHQAGACATFVGSMRDFNEGDTVRTMHLEHYPGMTEKQLGIIVDEVSKENGLLDVLVLHRVGDINPGEEIVLVGCWSSHRKAAFDGCRLIMEALKSKAPFWKKEKLLDGERWVSRNTPG